jgi:hypothetical protein
MLLVCFHRDGSLVSRAIQWQTMGPYSHVSLLLPDGRRTEARNGIGVVVEDTPIQTQDEQVDFYTLDQPLSNAELQQGMTFMDKEQGCPYDWWTLTYFLTRRTPSHGSETKWFCSEYVYAWLRASGRELFRGTEPWEVHPSLLSRSPLLIPLPDPCPFYS